MTYDCHSCWEIATQSPVVKRLSLTEKSMRMHENSAVFWSTRVAIEMQRGILATRWSSADSCQMCDIFKIVINKKSIEHSKVGGCANLQHLTETAPE